MLLWLLKRSRSEVDDPRSSQLAMNILAPVLRTDRCGTLTLIDDRIVKARKYLTVVSCLGAVFILLQFPVCTVPILFI